MKEIWKFPLNIADIQTIAMPVGAELLSVQVQFDMLCLWALVDPRSARREPRSILICGTGTPCESTAEMFVGTAQFGQVVWHVFDGGVL